MGMIPIMLPVGKHGVAKGVVVGYALGFILFAVVLAFGWMGVWLFPHHGTWHKGSYNTEVYLMEDGSECGTVYVSSDNTTYVASSDASRFWRVGGFDKYITEAKAKEVVEWECR